MIRRFISWRLDSVERMLGVPVDYLRHMLDVSVPAFLKFSKIMPLAQYRHALPADAKCVAGLVATRAEDCGTCVQIGVNLAKHERVPPAIIRAVLDSRVDDLPEPLADVYRFAEAVATNSGDEDLYRERVRQHYGEEGLVELAMAVAVARVFPTTKRALGYAKSCSVVKVQV